jgi:hypothetical protein
MTDHRDPIAAANTPLLPAPSPAEVGPAELRIPLLLDAAALERAASGDGLVELFGRSAHSTQSGSRLESTRRDTTSM